LGYAAIGIPGGFDEGGADWLFAQVFVHDAGRDPLHELGAETPHDRCIDPRGHDPERIGGRDEAVVRIEFLVPFLNHADARKPRESPRKRFAHFRAGMEQPDLDRVHE
jgi:hypothetical protein